MAQILKFPKSCKKPETCRKAFYERDGLLFILQEISTRQMEKVVRRDVSGYPMYFDRRGRYWPKNVGSGKVIYQ